MLDDQGIAEVVHISRETWEKFRQLGADEELRQMVQEAGFSIKLEFGTKVTVWPAAWEDAINAEGDTLPSAMYHLIRDNRGLLIDAELRDIIIRRFQAECPHDGERHTKDHGAIWNCNLCGASVDGPTADQ